MRVLLCLLALVLVGCNYVRPRELVKAEERVQEHQRQLDEIRESIVELPGLQQRARELTEKRTRLRSKLRKLKSRH